MVIVLRSNFCLLDPYFSARYFKGTCNLHNCTKNNECRGCYNLKEDLTCFIEFIKQVGEKR